MKKKKTGIVKKKIQRKTRFSCVSALGAGAAPTYLLVASLHVCPPPFQTLQRHRRLLARWLPRRGWHWGICCVVCGVPEPRSRDRALYKGRVRGRKCAAGLLV